MLDTTTIGAALRDARQLSGIGRRSAARALGVRRFALHSWERSRTTPSIAVLGRATNLYSHGLDRLLPARTPLIDPAHPGQLIVGDEVITRGTVNSAPGGPRASERDLLERYVDAVRRQRGLATHDPVELRRDDIAALAVYLDVTDPELGALLAEVLATTDERAVAARRALLLTALLRTVATGAIPDPWCRTIRGPRNTPKPLARTWTAIAPDVVDRQLGGNGLDGEPPFAPLIRRTRDRSSGGRFRHSPMSASFSVNAVERPTTVPLKPFTDEPRESAPWPVFGPSYTRAPDPRSGTLFAVPALSVARAKVPGETRALPPPR